MSDSQSESNIESSNEVVSSSRKARQRKAEAIPQMSKEKKNSGRKDGAYGKGKGKASSGFPNILRKIFHDNLVITLIILSFVVLIWFKYYEEKFTNESYLDDQDTFDYYDVLKCKRGDGIAKIKKNYRDLSKQYHPDSNKNCTDCEKKFQEITKAYKTLSDPRLKQAYDNTQGKTLKVIESNTISLNERNFKELVENSNDFWIIQIYSDMDSLSSSFSKIWEESYDKYKEFLNFGRINILTDSRLVKKRIPFKVKIYPTILILAPDNSYQIYNNIYNATSKDFQNFILNTYPDYIQNISKYNKLIKNEPIEQTNYFLDKNHSVLLLTSKTKLGLAVKYITFKFQSIYNTYMVRYNEIEQIASESLKNSIIDALKKLSIKKNEYIKENENFDYFLLVTNKEIKAIRRISPTNISGVYADSLKNNFIGLTSNNIDKVCGSVGSRHTYCYVTLVENLDEAQTLDQIMKTYKMLNNSYNDFIAKLDKESIDEQFYIQPVYVQKKDLTSNFNKFIQQASIHTYDSFFLDYASNTYATINEIKNLSDYSNAKGDINFLKKIYRDIEILSFEKIPDYCIPFGINCLYNVKKTFHYKLYTTIQRITKTQIIIAIIVAYILLPSMKQFGKLKYVIVACSVFLYLMIINIRNWFS